ncbi:NAD(P)-dependent alcohol dehydrogenase [uncultured Eudoraea sp.]|uniref:NAD(P)-dependent alcohol dehydrogenase n=1 Tax=uncultured Eudoraea sp. TaxID=1035614 RepID=UPI00260DF584|nr:NAD(P)-dependent alcohol dehydrogenase [uncultured Eudoraea sp.]
MKALVFTKYGSPEILQLREIDKPTPKENEVLVKIHATAVNDYDWSMIRGKPYLYRLLFGLLKPKHQIPGMELSGIIEALGTNVESFKVGDAVYGDISTYGFGGFAEYVCINEKALVIKPDKMSFEEATAIPHASALALQGLVDTGDIKKGQKVLINGAGGGMGTFGLQIAKLYDAEVTGVDTGDKLKMMTEIGFDHIIDYKKEDFTKNGQIYDLILDAKTTRSTFDYLRALSSKGKYVTVGGYLNRLFPMFLLKPWISIFSKKRIHIVALKPNKDLNYISELFEAGKIRPVIDGPFNLTEVPEALQYFGEGRHQGKVVIVNNTP